MPRKVDDANPLVVRRAKLPPAATSSSTTSPKKATTPPSTNAAGPIPSDRFVPDRLHGITDAGAPVGVGVGDVDKKPDTSTSMVDMRRQQEIVRRLGVLAKSL